MSTSTTTDHDVAVYSALATYLRTSAGSAAPAIVNPDTSLLASGLVDSLGMLQLTEHLSSTFDITFDDDDFTLENFETAGQIASLVHKKRPAS